MALGALVVTMVVVGAIGAVVATLAPAGFAASGAGPRLFGLPATPAPATAYQMPFPCGQVWTGSTRADHSPSPRALDWNAADDLGRPVLAAAAGTVTTAHTGAHLTASYGQYVVVDHGAGESTLYAHLATVTVTVGQAVVMGQQIGTVGSTGDSTGPHLHFEERLDGVDQDVWLDGALYPIGVPTASANCATTSTAAPAPVASAPPVTLASARVLPLAGNLLGSQTQTILFHRGAHPRFTVPRAHRPTRRIDMGAARDLPVVGDWDGDGRDNVGVRDPATRSFSLRVHGHDRVIRLGRSADLPVAGNWDGVGGWEVGVRKAHSGVFKLRADDGSITRVSLGDAADLPVTGDWNGDGRTDLGVYDPATSVFTLRWTTASGTVQTAQVTLGAPGDLPVAGDWSGDGHDDVGVWDPHTREVTGQVTGATTGAITGG